MNIRLKKHALALGVAIVVSGSTVTALSAQEFGGANTTADPTEVVSDIQARSQALPVTASRTQSAREMAMDFLNSAVDSGLLDTGTGWNSGPEIFVAIGVAEYPVSNPAADPNFGQARALKSLEASLEAKKNIIEYVRVDLDFSSAVSLPETGLGTAFDLIRDELQYDIDVALFNYQTALEKFGDAKADYLQGVTLGDLMKEGIAGFVQSRFNPGFDLAKVEEAQLQRFEFAQNDLLAMQSRLDQLNMQAAELRGRVLQSQGFDVETFAAMTVVGAAMVGQFESWKDGNYQIAVIYMWSPQQERQVRNILAGTVEQGKPGRQSLGNYIRNTDWSTAIGGRKFTDDRGSMHVVGIGAWPIRGNSSAQRRAAEGFALRMAQSQVALAFSGDVVSQSRAQARMDEIASGGLDGEVNSDFGENFAQELSQSTQMSLQGVQTRYSNVTRHPISGQDMHVVVVTASAAQTGVAKEMEKALFRSAGAVAGSQQFSRGVRAGMEQELNRQRGDTVSFREGFVIGSDSTSAQTPPVAAPSTPTATPETPGQPASVIGGGTSMDAFSW
jgi:hypothetical protein